jgi:hypothetical protein
MAGKTAANLIDLVSINGIPADCAAGFGGGYDWSGGTITRVVHYGRDDARAEQSTVSAPAQRRLMP